MSKFPIAAFAAFMLSIAPALAVDTMTTKDAPDLSKPRAAIKANDYKTAIESLKVLVNQGVQHADLYNLLGYSYRKSGDVAQAKTFYAKALDFDPDHKAALEYQGELFVQIGDIAKAQANLTRLTKLCPSGCEEREDLEQALKKAGAKI